MTSMIVNTMARAAILALATMALTTAAEAKKTKLTTLYSFVCDAGKCPNGSLPNSLVVDPAGNLYGTAIGGGAKGNGVIFKLAPNADKTSWTYSVVYSFQGNASYWPNGPLVLDASGNIFGTLRGRSAGLPNFSVAYELHNGGTFEVIYNFCAQVNCIDGSEVERGFTYPGQATGLQFDGASPLYSTATSGGPANNGLVFDIFLQSGKWKEGSVHTIDAENNTGMILLDEAGNKYLSARGSAGGDKNGAILKEESGVWSRYFDLCKGACKEGRDPVEFTLDKAGNIFMATDQAGVRGRGALSRIGLNKKVKVYHAVCAKADCTDGDQPQPLIVSSKGIVYGTMKVGGANATDPNGTGGGTLYQIGAKWKNLYSFCAQANCADGAYPTGPLAIGGDGTIYGTTVNGGAGSEGTVFAFKP